MKYFPQTLSAYITINALKYGLFGCGIALKFEALDLWTMESWLENDHQKSQTNDAQMCMKILCLQFSKENN